MDWLGIGVFIISIGFAVMVFFLIPVLKKLTVALNTTSETIEVTKNSLEEISGETKLVIYNTNATLLDLNSKLNQLDPLFRIVHDTGESAHHLTSSLLKVTTTQGDKMENLADMLDRNKLQGLVRGMSFMYYLFQAKKAADKQESQ